MPDETPVVPPVVVPVPTPVVTPPVVVVQQSKFQDILVGFLVVAVVAQGIALGVYMLHHEDGPPVPQPAIDQSFVAVGHQYGATLQRNNSAAWGNFATSLKSMPLSKALAKVGQDFNALRQADYDKILTPALAKIVPDGTPDASVTPAQLEALQAAGNGLAKGLSK